jgi:PAS domain S-box/diguanylate cyclase (GGDEF) domain
MKLDIATLAFITSILFAMQSVAVFVQYRLNRRYAGIGWWLCGAVLEAVGFLLMLTLYFPSIRFLSVLANPSVITGQIFLGIGASRFVGKKDCRWLSFVLSALFILPYLYFILVQNSIWGRSITVYAATAVIAAKIAVTLFTGRKKPFLASACFLASVFLGYSLIQTVMTVVTFILPPIRTYSELSLLPVRAVAFVAPPVWSVLWTTGFIIMLNQRLHAEIIEEKEKLRRVFNTSPDAHLITRISDSLVVDVNDGFLSITGYGREEMVGNLIPRFNLWVSSADRSRFLECLLAAGAVNCQESDFRRKDGSVFNGSISGRILTIDGVPHAVSTVRDITESKIAQAKIQDLVQQLEFEKRAAELNAVTDSLTSLMNRRYFDDALRTEFFRLKRSGAPLSLIILDIDHFKNFNDTYGHLAGDNCLRQMGSILRIVVKRLSDVVARYGGEEFVVIMPETESSGAFAIAEQIRQGVEDLAIPHADSDTADHVTVSLGVVTVHTGSMDEPEQVVALADRALYEAKHGGRNRIVTGGL